MKVIKKEIELIEFKSGFNGNSDQVATKIIKLSSEIDKEGLRCWVLFNTEKKNHIIETISMETYNELLKHLGWGKE